VPDRFWRAFFIVSDPLAAKIWGPLIGPVVAIVYGSPDGMDEGHEGHAHHGHAHGMEEHPTSST
jgi:hypothetical protein